MDFVISDNELAALCGLPHIQQLAYLRGVRPYMDVQTGFVGIKRGVSYQSIAEQLYVEPHQGIKSASYSRAQVRRALSGLARAGLIQLQSEGLKLILKCNLASRPYSVQNKAVTKPSQQGVMEPLSQPIEIEEVFTNRSLKADIGKTQKADTPLKDNNYIYLLSQFERFWSLYPEKKSKHKAQAVFEQLNPEPMLFQQLIQALQAQISQVEAMQLRGTWVPPWKYPANWLTQRCWEDELSATDALQETAHAEHTKHTRQRDAGSDMFCPPCEVIEPARNNVIRLQR